MLGAVLIGWAVMISGTKIFHPHAPQLELLFNLFICSGILFFIARAWFMEFRDSEDPEVVRYSSTFEFVWCGMLNGPMCVVPVIIVLMIGADVLWGI